MMIKIDIPGYKNIEAHHLVLDFNGTLAIDGKLIEGTKPLLDLLAKQLNLHVLTAENMRTFRKHRMQTKTLYYR